MLRRFLFLLVGLVPFSLHAQMELKRLDWDGLEVVYLPDNRLPTYTLSFYFAEGALGDHKLRGGETAAALQWINLGTRRFDYREIVENLDFYGSRTSSSVTHEFSTFTVSGLIKDLVPTIKMVCHLLTDATYPKDRLDREKKLIVEGLKSMVSEHGALASRAERELTMQGTPFSYPSEGKIESLQRIQPEYLKGRLESLLKQVKKRVYITGPKEVLGVRRILKDECGFADQSELRVTKATVEKLPPQAGPRIYLVPVKEANQAQVRLGQFLDPSQIERRDHLIMASEYLGSGGFTSRLLQELRVKRGLTYSAFAYAGGQIGRAHV